MTDQSNVFSPSPEVTNEGDKAQKDSFLSQLVGEGKKYATEEELAKAYVNADAHIKTVESDNSVLKEQVAKSKTLDEALEEFRKEREAKGEVPEVTTSPTPNSLTEDKVKQMFKEYENSKARQENVNKVEKALVERFGENAKSVVNEKAKELGTTAEHLQVLAADSPNMVLELFNKSSESHKSVAIPESTVNAPTPSSTGTLYEQLNHKRRQEGRKLFTKAERALLIKEAQEKGLDAVGLG